MEKLTEAERKYFETRGREAPSPKATEPEGAALQAEQAAMPEATEPEAGAPETPQPKASEAPQRESKRVPLAELLAERERRKESEAKLGEARERAEALSQQMQKILGGPGAEPLPDPEREPAAYLKTVRERAAREAEEIARWRKERETASQKQQELQQFLSAYRAEAADFARRQPDFTEAYRHLVADRNAELLGLGFNDPALRARIVHEEEAAVARRALADEANPAERIYAAAKRRGYRPGASAAEKLKLAAEGQEQARSLGAASGGMDGRPSPEALAGLDDDAFAAATQGAKWKRLWG